MKIIIPRAELKDAVAGIGKVVSNRTTLPILNSVRFDSAKGVVTAQATDLDQTVAYRFRNAQAEGTGACIVPFHVLKDLAKGIEGESVEIEPVDDETVAVTNHVGAHTLKHNVTGFPAKDWPPTGDEIQTKPADRFLPIYRRLSPFASTDATRRVLNGVYVDMKGKGENNVTLVACDGRRLTCCNSLKLPIKTKDGVIVPVTKFLNWAALGDECSIGINKGKNVQTFALEVGSWTYRTKVPVGIYPNWRQVLPGKDDTVNQFAFTDTDVEAAKKLLPAVPGGDGIVLVGNADGTMTLVGQNKGDKEETTVQLAGGSRYTGTATRVVVNRFFLLDALNAGFRNFGFMDGHAPLRADDDAGGTHVLMPLRLGTEPEKKPEEKTETAETTPESEQVSQTTTPATTPVEQPKGDTKRMTKETTENGTTEQGSALDKVLAAVETAKSNLKAAVASMSDVADAVKTAVKSGKAQASDLVKARTTLQKLQTISL